jgi:hypothetical protein
MWEPQIQTADTPFGYQPQSVPPPVLLLVPRVTVFHAIVVALLAGVLPLRFVIFAVTDLIGQIILSVLALFEEPLVGFGFGLLVARHRVSHDARILRWVKNLVKNFLTGRITHDSLAFVAVVAVLVPLAPTPLALALGQLADLPGPLTAHGFRHD